MSNSESFAVARLQRDVPGAEARIDDAIIALSTLMTSVVTARRETSVAAKTGQATIIRLAKAQMSLIDISNEVLRAHGELADIGKETAGLDLHECPSMAVAPSHLAAVA